MPRRKQSHPQPVKCEGVKGQGSGARSGEEQGWGQYRGLRSGRRGAPEVWGRASWAPSHLPKVPREPERVTECGKCG